MIAEKLLVHAEDVNRLFDQAGIPWLEELLAYLEEQTMVSVEENAVANVACGIPSVVGL
jgi:hypothetical protein